MNTTVTVTVTSRCRARDAHTRLLICRVRSAHVLGMAPYTVFIDGMYNEKAYYAMLFYSLQITIYKIMPTLLFHIHTIVG